MGRYHACRGRDNSGHHAFAGALVDLALERLHYWFIRKMFQYSRQSKPEVSKTNVLSDRAQHLLKALVEQYVGDGRPVGSRTLAKGAGLELSPATIRNVMADLEDMGFVVSPHTSAGRVPTAKGYRFFVDTLISMRPPGETEVKRIKQRLFEESREQDNLSGVVSDLLSGVTQMAGLVTLPSIGRSRWRHLEFLPLSDNRVLSIMVIDDHEVQNRIIHTGRAYGSSELTQAANYLNQAFVGRTVQEVRERLLREMQETREHMDRMMLDAIAMAEKVVGEPRGEDFVVKGETNLMSFQELSNVDVLKKLFEAFNQKRDILHILDQCQNAEGVQLFIGEESGYSVLDECSMVTSPYEVDGQVVGVLGVIGPTRMAYDRVIPIVDITAKLLGSALNRRH